MPSVQTVCALGLVACTSLDAATLSRAQADAFERKVDQVIQPLVSRAQPRRTVMAQDEINSWFAYRAQPVLPEGITEPQATLLGAGRVTGQATLDLEAIGRRRASGSWLDPWSLLGGRLPLMVTGTLQTANGFGRFALESATLGGIPVPKALIQELLGVYTRNSSRPRGVNLDEAFPLPVGIRQIEIGRGESVVVQ